MRTPKFNVENFRERRRQFAERAPQSALIIFSPKERHLAPFRQDSNLYYLTGFEEAHSILLMRPGLSPETILFVHPKDPVRETWEGFMYGVEGAVSSFGVDEAYPYTEFAERAPELLKDVKRIYFSLGSEEEHDRIVIKALDQSRALFGRSGKGRLPIFDPLEVLSELRVTKSPFEIERMRASAQLSAEAHIEVMKFTRPGVTERQIHGQLIASFFGADARREGYESIVATGNNATALHYRFNDQVCREGELLLIDAGAEKDYYTADITRCFPVSGKFSPAQRKVYEAVLRVQKTLVSMVRPGISMAELQEKAIALITDELLQLKLLSGSADENIRELKYKKYYPHSIGHYLGMDVHDVGLYRVGDQPRPLEAGMTITVEPGIYIPGNDQEAPAEYRGIGVRIEDDVLVTSGGHEVLTSLVPKEVDEIEKICQAR